MVERISTGIFGLDNLLEGGFLPNSVTGVLGSPGTGKTIFALQFCLDGLQNKEHALYLTFEESPEKLLREAELMGLNQLRQYYEEGSLVFHYASGEEVVSFLVDVLPNEIDDLKREISLHSRVVLDPLTPVLWELEERKKQRFTLTKAFDNLREFGTILATLEEPMGDPGFKTQETAIPLYLVDNIVNLQYLGLGGNYNRTLKIMKSRGTKHGEQIYPLTIVRGAGLIVTSEVDGTIALSQQQDYSGIFEKYFGKIKRLKDSPQKTEILNRMNHIKRNWQEPQSPENFLKELFEKAQRSRTRI